MVTPKALLFDLDGTLVETRDLHHSALQGALLNCGYNHSMEELKKLCGLPTTEKLRLLGYSSTEIPRISLEKQRLTLPLIRKTIRPWEPLVRFLELLSDRYPLAVVSNAVGASVREMLLCANIDFYFEVVISNEDVSSPKPAPEGYLRACELLKVSPASALVVEDNPVGVAAGEAAGCSVVVVKGPRDIPSLLRHLLD